MLEPAQQQLQNLKRIELTNLTANDSDGRKCVPERRERVVVTTVVAESSTSSLNTIYQTYQALHRRHLHTLSKLS